VCVPLVVDARRNVTSIFAALLAAEIVEGIGLEAIAVMVVAKRADVPFVLKRVFLLSML
jgi:hypothetical protein